MRKSLKTLVAVAVAAGVCVIAVLATRHDSAAHPNVLLITVDTLRADHLHCYGFPLDTSPSIDAFTAGSVLFERAIAASGYTGPSHASMMTSQYPREHPVGYNNGHVKLTAAGRTLAAMFRQAGYATAAFVSSAVVARPSGLDGGFDTYDDELAQPEPNRPDTLERIAQQTTQRALAWLGARREQPFFMWVHYQDPHGPYIPPEPFTNQFHLASDGQPELPVLQGEIGFGGIPHYQVLDGLRRQAEYEGRYAGEIAYADHWIGQLLAQARSASRPLVVLLTADHGESFGEDNYYFAHGHSTAPDLSHVPFILHLPGRAAERRTELVSHVDIMPTLLDAAGLPVPPDLEGISLVPFLRTGAQIPERTVYCDIGYELSAYRNTTFVRAQFVTEKSWALMLFYQFGQAGRQDALPRPADLKAQQTFHWSGGRTWEASDSSPGLSSDLLAYLAKKPAPAGTAISLSPGEAERLRALGYGTAPNSE
jgi:arylsulfatase A-like enzyme